MAINLKDLMNIEIEISIEDTNSLFEGHQAQTVIGGESPTPRPMVGNCGDRGSPENTGYYQRTGCDGRDPVGCDVTHISDY